MSELSDEARALLAQVRSDQLDEPSADDRARLRARLAATLALSTLGGTAASAAMPKTAAAQLASATLSTKIVVASLVVATAGAAAFGLRRDTESAAPPRAAAPASAALAAPAAPAPSEVVQVPSAVAEGAAEHAADGTVDDADRSMLAPARKAVVRRAQERPPSEPSQPAPPPSLQAELWLITAAQEALRAGRPQLALRRAAEHATRFPQGALVQERLGIDAIAACALGERARGLQALKKLARRAPNAPLLVRARAACREPDAE